MTDQRKLVAAVAKKLRNLFQRNLPAGVNERPDCEDCDFIPEAQELLSALDALGGYAQDKLDAERYRWLRSRDLDTIQKGGVFAGLTPKNVVLNGETLDEAVDAALRTGSE